MDFLAIGALILRSLQVISNNPALGGGSSVKLAEISELLGLFGQLFERGDEALDELRAFADIVEAMANEGRAPTRAEWDVLRGRSDAAHEVIQEAAEQAREEEEEEEAERQRIADEEAARVQQELEAELAQLLSIPEEERTPEQIARIEEITSPEEGTGVPGLESTDTEE